MEAQAGRLRPTTPDEEGEEAFLFLSFYIYIYVKTFLHVYQVGGYGNLQIRS
jgi:hypothetical protein